jgi:hypothetical protein
MSVSGRGSENGGGGSPARLVPLVGWALLVVGALLCGVVSIFILPDDRLRGLGALLALGTITVAGGIAAFLVTVEPEMNDNGIVLKGARLVQWRDVLSYRHIAPAVRYWYVLVKYQTSRGTGCRWAIVFVRSVETPMTLSQQTGRDATVLDQYVPEKRRPPVGPGV